MHLLARYELVGYEPDGQMTAVGLMRQRAVDDSNWTTRWRALRATRQRLLAAATERASYRHMTERSAYVAGARAAAQLNKSTAEVLGCLKLHDLKIYDLKMTELMESA